MFCAPTVALTMSIDPIASINPGTTGHQVRFEYIPNSLQRTAGRLSSGFKLKS
jgi:hypothetical protein